MLEVRLMPPNILALHTDYFQSINGQGILREALERHAVSTVFLLHEFGDPENEIELGIFELGYRDGVDQYSTSQQTDWFVYASQESSITVENATAWISNSSRPSFFAFSLSLNIDCLRRGVRPNPECSDPAK